MNREEIVHVLEVTHINGGEKPSVIRVMCKDDITHYGFFVTTNDYAELKEKNYFRFVPRNSFRIFNDEYSKKGQYNLKHCIIIDGEDVIHIEYVMPISA